MVKNPARLLLIVAGLFIAGLIAVYIATTTVPVGEKLKSLKDLGGEFHLNSINGVVDLKEYEGKVVVLYFGFLNCAEVCPASMGVMSAAFKKLPADQFPNVQGFFISVDPKRDDLNSLNEFAQYFDQRIQGLTGTQDEINALTKQYGVYFDLVDMESSELGYTVDHSSRFYIISPTGQLIDAMSHSTTPIELAERIKRTLN